MKTKKRVIQLPCFWPLEVFPDGENVPIVRVETILPTDLPPKRKKEWYDNEYVRQQAQREVRQAFLLMPYIDITLTELKAIGD